jgi:hypothetical protein
VTGLAPATEITLAGSTLGEHRHVCALFASADDEYRTLLPFSMDGLAHGERVVHIVPRRRDDHHDRLRAGGIDVNAARREQRLEVLRSEETYIRDGHFDHDAMISLIQLMLRTGHALGFPRTRVVGHAEHIVQDPYEASALIAYESRLNEVLPSYPDVVICTYDLDRISAQVAMDVLRTHPVAIIGGLLQENPFFASPTDLMHEQSVPASPRVAR